MGTVETRDTNIKNVCLADLPRTGGYLPPAPTGDQQGNERTPNMRNKGMLASNKSLFHGLLSLLIVMLTLPALSAFAFGQPPEHREEKVKLLKDNFDFRKKDDGKYYVTILGALNPKDGKPLDGTHKLEYYCQKAVAAVFISVVLAKGYAESVLKCKPDERPFLWLYLNLGS